MRPALDKVEEELRYHILNFLYMVGTQKMLGSLVLIQEHDI